MKRGCRRTHHDCANLEWNVIRQQKCVSSRNDNELGIAPVAMLPDHLNSRTKLLVPAGAEVTRAAANEIVNTYAIARCDVMDTFTYGFDSTRDFMSKCDRERFYWRNARAIMRIGMAD